MEIIDVIELDINGRLRKVSIKKSWTLLYVLREVFNLTGSKCGCSTGDCGACKIILDGEAVNSCLILARNAVGKKILTIEGLSDGINIHPIQQAFIDCGAVQCGYCTPGMIMSAKALLDKNPNPSEEDVRKSIDNNLCRCTGYVKIVEAILLSAKRMGGITCE
ncbi:(2Fe-2S)-binding protein [Clostridioides sp. ES-S-0145-01]|uniref:(2Fe-2S)-binding protein n=1 Tax=unclassified Clostridioides TaxID=2635829 RepID=UPI0039BCDDA1